jgi:uncharacterized protein YkwD
MARKMHGFRLAPGVLVLTTAVSLAAAGATAEVAGAATRAHSTHTVKHHTTKAKHHKTHTKAKHAAVKPTAVRTASAASQAPAPAPPPVAAPTSCPDGGLVPSAANLDRVRAAVLCLIDQQRASAGLGGLRENADLEAAATAHSADMVASNYFDHLPPTGVSLVDQVLGSGYATVGTLLGLGENIATGVGSQSTPATTVAVWMASPGHRDNVLNPGFTDTGIGVVAATPALLGSGRAGATYTEWFGAAG